MSKLSLILKTEMISAKVALGDISLLPSEPLYCQPMGLTVPEWLAQRLDSAN